VHDFLKRPRLEKVSLPHIVVDVQKYLCHQDLVHLFAVVGQQLASDPGARFWSELTGS
jgi:hypothetical protein